MATHDTSPAAPAPRGRQKLRAAWCECGTHCYDPVYMPDDFCPCGEDKHHYHCPACGGISQVG